MINTYKKKINTLLPYYKEKSTQFAKLREEYESLSKIKAVDFVKLSMPERKAHNIKRAELYEQSELTRARLREAESAINHNLKCLIATVGNMIIPRYIGMKVGEKTRKKIENEMKYYLSDVCTFILLVDRKGGEYSFSVGAFVIQGSTIHVNQRAVVEDDKSDVVFDIPEAFVLESPELIERSIQESSLLEKEYYESVKPELEKILKALKEKYPVATKSGKFKFPDLNLNSWYER